jgi:hypothetical protein
VLAAINAISAASTASASAAIKPIIDLFMKLLYRSCLACDESAHSRVSRRMFK